MFGITNAQQITLDTSLVSNEANTIDEFWYWSGGFPVLGTGFTPNSTVTVYDTDPNGKRWRDFTGTVDSQGKFSVKISAKMRYSVKGAHTIKATDGQGKTASAILNVVPEANAVLEASVSSSVLTMSQLETQGFKLKIKGLEPYVQVKVHLFSPNESGSELRPNDQKIADANGEFEMNINMFTQSYPWGESLPDTPGLWRINVSDFNANGHKGYVNFRVLPNSPSPTNYCTVQQQSNFFAPTPITSFEVVGVNSNTSSASSSLYYEDFTNKIFDLTAGQTYTVKLKGKNGSSFAADTYTLFIDWNQNGILDEENELVQEGYLFNSTGEDEKFTEFQFTVPENVLNGNTRLRILKVVSATTYSMFWPKGACGYYYSTGQVEDYTLNISGGVTDPGCDFICPADINVNSLSGANTAIVNYDLNFNCTPPTNTSCVIDYPGNNFENLMVTSNFSTVANDFVIPAGKTLKIDKIIPHFIRFSYGATLAFYKDNNGKPGELIVNYATPTIESQTVIGNTSNGAVYEIVIKLPELLELTEGKYWVAINAQGPLVSWETKSALSNGTTAFTGSGQTWTPKEGFDGVFKVSYVCEPAMPEVVLVQGLESGADFPVGNTIVIHNLVYEGVVIDTCVFNVNVTAILTTAEVVKNQVRFYPNPVKDFLKVSYDKEIQSLDIYDMSGKRVYSKELNRKEADINLSSLPSGNYIVNAKILGEVKTFKIIKK
ncbi:hypothetical protein IO90_03840 [Chryseobacterium sp. FH1]|nr:hypothetical protein IO90_03840 [Chryseobacterium sp. FH1]